MAVVHSILQIQPVYSVLQFMKNSAFIFSTVTQKIIKKIIFPIEILSFAAYILPPAKKGNFTHLFLTILQSRSFLHETTIRLPYHINLTLHHRHRCRYGHISIHAEPLYAESADNDGEKYYC